MIAEAQVGTCGSTAGKDGDRFSYYVDNQDNRKHQWLSQRRRGQVPKMTTVESSVVRLKQRRGKLMARPIQGAQPVCESNKRTYFNSHYQQTSTVSSSNW